MMAEAAAVAPLFAYRETTAARRHAASRSERRSTAERSPRAWQLTCSSKTVTTRIKGLVSMPVEIPASRVCECQPQARFIAVRLRAQCLEVEVRQGRSLWQICKVSACKARRKAFYERPDLHLDEMRGRRSSRQAKVCGGEITFWRLLPCQEFDRIE